ncbi:hypothetical protein HETIRDRAFT_36708 [Heterobasidion irregulare TC 32-1]|uniref:F-box domain-containing protein n=1 Tax=Heterobasidion irregulare (strain TC 32-1) TaxID=747525 RepID=W4K760_HETIT|nr:uncharacterized protein HETIRDRAFT_36708 [Heterobasidion irregulare TC 32-1]ETW81672.1 hypothetical protein HETIRDRAFT_36708 [Heterobasidion irregulare TC 32-1]
MYFLALPADILLIVIKDLDVKGLVALSEACHLLRRLVHEYGWKSHIRLYPRPSYSMAKALSQWCPGAQIKYHTLSDKAWARTTFAARPLSRPWHGKLQPLLAINNSRLVVAAGHILYSYAFTTSGGDGITPGMRFECSYSLLRPPDSSKHDITAVVFLPDRGDRTLFVGFVHGALERIYLPPMQDGRKEVTIDPVLRTPFHYHHGDIIESLSITSDLLLSLTENGTAGLLNLSFPTPSPHMIELGERGWAAYLSTQSSTPYAAFGTSSDNPLAVHTITNSEISATPSSILWSSVKDFESERSSAVYGISSTPPGFPWGASDNILVSGWYDGFVHVHDLRSPTCVPRLNNSPAPLFPVLSLSDPWSFEPVYSVSCGGGSSSHIAAGTARHSVVAFWDVRSPKTGWSVHAPGNDSSPVYSVILESSRLFGATQSRPFVYDFGPGVTPDTYPPLPRVHGDDGLSYKKGWNNVGFYVTKYSHRTTQLP